MQERAAGPREVRRIRGACVPPERRRVELERSGARFERGRLVAEHRRREHVEEAVAAVTRGIRVMQPGGRLEHEVAVAATADEAGEVRRRGSARAAAPDFGAEAALGEPADSWYEDRVYNFPKGPVRRLAWPTSVERAPLFWERAGDPYGTATPIWATAPNAARTTALSRRAPSGRIRT